MTHDNDRQQTINILSDIIDDVRVGMLTTIDADGMMSSRPMWAAKTQFDGDLWFFTSPNKAMVAEINSNDRVNVSFACPVSKRYATLSGTATLVREQRKLETLWQPEFAEWFPGELDSDDLSLLKVAVDRAHYWDDQSKRMGQFVDTVKSLFTGKSRTETSEGEIEWSKGQPNEFPKKKPLPPAMSPRETIMAGKELTEREKGNI